MSFASFVKLSPWDMNRVVMVSCFCYVLSFLLSFPQPVKNVWLKIDVAEDDCVWCFCAFLFFVSFNEWMNKLYKLNKFRAIPLILWVKCRSANNVLAMNIPSVPFNCVIYVYIYIFSFLFFAWTREKMKKNHMKEFKKNLKLIMSIYNKTNTM